MRHSQHFQAWGHRGGWPGAQARAGWLLALAPALLLGGCGGQASREAETARQPAANREAAKGSSCDVDEAALREGTALLESGEANAAKERLARGLASLEACHEPDKVRLAATLYALGEAHTALRELDRARDRFETALVLNRKLYGPVHEYTVETMEMLGVVADYAGDYREAEAAFRAVVAALGERLPATHPDMLRARSNLAINLKLQKRYAEAERILDAVIPELRRLPPGEALGHALNVLGTILYDREDFERARANFGESAVILEAVRGPKHPDVATPLYNLCGLELDAKHLDAALEACERARTIREAVYPASHPQVQSVVQRHEEVRRALGLP
ncbi:MAG: tetratricopeptide repeat protein [Polyangiaceae bacterium]